MSGTRLGGLRAAATRGHGGPGLAQMLRETPPGLCPFCLDPLPESSSRKRVRCDAPECETAYFRCWRRDERHPPDGHHVIRAFVREDMKRGARKARQPEMTRRMVEGHRRRNAA